MSVGVGTSVRPKAGPTVHVNAGRWGEMLTPREARALADEIRAAADRAEREAAARGMDPGAGDAWRAKQEAERAAAAAAAAEARRRAELENARRRRAWELEEGTAPCARCGEPVAARATATGLAWAEWGGRTECRAVLSEPRISKRGKPTWHPGPHVGPEEERLARPLEVGEAAPGWRAMAADLRAGVWPGKGDDVVPF